MLELKNKNQIQTSETSEWSVNCEGKLTSLNKLENHFLPRISHLLPEWFFKMPLKYDIKEFCVFAYFAYVLIIHKPYSWQVSLNMNIFLDCFRLVSHFPEFQNHKWINIRAIVFWLKNAYSSIICVMCSVYFSVFFLSFLLCTSPPHCKRLGQVNTIKWNISAKWKLLFLIVLVVSKIILNETQVTSKNPN